MKRENSISQLGLDQFLTLLDADPDRAAKRYNELYHSLCRFAEWKGSHTPEEHTDETIDRVCHKLDKGLPIADLFKYCRAVLHYVILESLKNERLAEFDEQTLSLRAAPKPDEEDPRQECFNRCLSQLPPDNRALIVRYYEGHQRIKIENRKRLAAELGITDHNLNVRASRIREKLQDCGKKCLKRL